jgi:hypothetical protein
VWFRRPQGRPEAASGQTQCVKGKMAGSADRLVQLWLQVALLWAVHGAQWAMENPEGSLARRPYMRAMVGEHVVRQA